MKLLSFSLRGTSSWGAVVEDNRVADLGAATAGRAPTLRAALETLAPHEIEALAAHAPRVATLDEIRFLPVVTNPRLILCVGLNYDAHRQEANRAETAVPTIFTRFAASQVGHREPMLVPPESTQLDYEGEIAIVIGRAGRRISEADAWSHIAGYARPTTTARSATGRPTPRSGRRARTSSAPVGSGRGWSRAATSPTARSCALPRG